MDAVERDRLRALLAVLARHIYRLKDSIVGVQEIQMNWKLYILGGDLVIGRRLALEDVTEAIKDGRWEPSNRGGIYTNGNVDVHRDGSETLEE
jgi:hypothetical protein